MQLNVAQKSKKGWSLALTYVYPGFKKDDISFTLSSACFIVATEWTCSYKSGSNENVCMFTLHFNKWYADTFSTYSTLLVKLIKKIHVYSKLKTPNNRGQEWTLVRFGIGALGYNLRNAGLYICTCFLKTALSFWFGILTFKYNLCGICESWQNLMLRDRYTSVIVGRKEDVTVFADRL